MTRAERAKADKVRAIWKAKRHELWPMFREMAVVRVYEPEPLTLSLSAAPPAATSGEVFEFGLFFSEEGILRKRLLGTPAAYRVMWRDVVVEEGAD